MFSYFCLASSKIASTACFSVSVFEVTLLCAAVISRPIQATKYHASSVLISGAPATSRENFYQSKVLLSLVL